MVRRNLPTLLDMNPDSRSRSMGPLESSGDSRCMPTLVWTVATVYTNAKKQTATINDKQDLIPILRRRINGYCRITMAKSENETEMNMNSTMLCYDKK